MMSADPPVDLPEVLQNLPSILAQICRQPDRFLVLVDRDDPSQVGWSSLGSGSNDPAPLLALRDQLQLDTQIGKDIFRDGVNLALQLGRSSFLPQPGSVRETASEVNLQWIDLPEIASSQALMLVSNPEGEGANQTNSSRIDSLLLGLEQAGEGFAITDQEGNFAYLNRAHSEMFGYDSADELIGKSWRALYNEDEADRLEREVIPLLVQDGKWAGISTARRKDGSLFEEALTLSLTPDGRIICNCQDRSRELAALRNLERQAELFRKVAENLPSGVLIHRREGPYLFANRAAQEFLPLVTKGLVGRKPEEIFPKAVTDQLKLISDDQLADEPDAQPLRKDVSFEGKTGTETIEVVKFLIPDLDDHQQEAICSIYTDVTQVRQIESQLRGALEQKSTALTMQREFVSMISHEFRSPMAAIQGTSHLIEMRLNGNLPGKIGRHLEIQKESLKTLGELVDQVLILNRLETAISEPDLIPTNVAEFIESIVDYFNESATEPRIHLVLPSEDLEAQPVDTALLKAAVENLISNAIKYSARPKPVYVRLAQKAGCLEISVEDYGRGIPTDEQQRLFTTFFRAKNVGSVPGTGLGLRIVQRSVDFHRGSVHFHSKENEGSTFTIKIPVATQ